MPKTDKHASRAVFVAVDVCAHHQFPALILMEIQPSGVGTGTRLLGSKSCCSQCVERMRWRVDADDLRRVAASLIQQADSMSTYETRADDESLSYGVRCLTCGEWETACSCED